MINLLPPMTPLCHPLPPSNAYRPSMSPLSHHSPNTYTHSLPSSQSHQLSLFLPTPSKLGFGNLHLLLHLPQLPPLLPSLLSLPLLYHVLWQQLNLWPFPRSPPLLHLPLPLCTPALNKSSVLIPNSVACPLSSSLLSCPPFTPPLTSSILPNLLHQPVGQSQQCPLTSQLMVNPLPL